MNIRYSWEMIWNSLNTDNNMGELRKGENRNWLTRILFSGNISLRFLILENRKVEVLSDFLNFLLLMNEEHILTFSFHASPKIC